MRNSLIAALATALVLVAVKVGCGSDPITQLLAIGSPCKQSSDCGTQPSFYCVTDHPNGYCQKDCESDADCPPEAICAFAGPTSGACHQRCDIPSNCRLQYSCKDASNNPDTLASHKYCDVGGGVLPDFGVTTMDAGPTDGPADGPSG